MLPLHSQGTVGRLRGYLTGQNVPRMGGALGDVFNKQVASRLPSS